MINEIDTVQNFVNETSSDGSNSGAQEVLLSFGPSPGSFFADDCRSTYRWANLPRGLEDAIQKIVCKYKYGKIYDVMMNAKGGWVIQLEKGKKYMWGGELPARLDQALSDGKKRNASIKV